MKRRRNMMLIIILLIILSVYAILQSRNKKMDVKEADAILDIRRGEKRNVYEVNRRHLHIVSENITAVFTNNHNENTIASAVNVSERKEKEVKSIKTVQDNDPDKLYKERRELLFEVCSRQHFNIKTPRVPLKRNIIDRRQHIAYCTIQKTASTFWKRVFRIVIGESMASSPFDESVLALGRFDHLENITKDFREKFMKQSLTFLFVRDPFSRLFSGYVDKLFSHNYFFWTLYGSF